MIEKNGFVVTSRWAYCYISATCSKVYQKPETGQARIATSKDKEIYVIILGNLRYLGQQQRIMHIYGDRIILIWVVVFCEL